MGRRWMKWAVRRAKVVQTIVEAAAAGSGNVGENAVERDAAFFVGIEALIKEVAQESTVLRDALTINPRNRSDGIWAVLGVGGKIAYGREAEPATTGSAQHKRIHRSSPAESRRSDEYAGCWV